MNVKVNGASSELEYESKKKLINLKTIKKMLDDDKTTSKDFKVVQHKIIDMLQFYDRVIKSININLKSIEKKSGITYSEKKDMFYITQEKELSQAKREKNQFRQYLKKVKERLGE